MPDTTARSCVISSSPMPCSRCSCFSRSRICAWIVTSSAVVGSSAIRKSGSAASVIAIITRCFWPPLRRNGYSSMRRSGSGMPTRPSHSIALARAAAPRSGVCASIASTICSPTRITGFRLVAGSWKIMPMRPPRTARMPDSGSASTSCPSSATRPCVTSPLSGSSRISASAVMLLPQPDSPTSAKVSPRRIDSVRPSMALTRPASASSATLRSSMFSMRRRPKRRAAFDRPQARPEAAGARVERIAHAVGEQVGGQHQRDHEGERRRERPPDHRVAAHLGARQVDHAAEAVHRRIDADARRTTAPPRRGSAPRNRAPS